MSIDIFARGFRKGEQIYEYGDCPSTISCDGILLEYGDECRCNGCGRIYNRSEITPVEASDIVREIWEKEEAVNGIWDPEDDLNKTQKLISWWGFELNSEICSGNNYPGGYMPYEAYTSLLKIIAPDQAPVSEDIFMRVIERVWR